MAADKKHRDEQELERYGVWVKAGPDEIDEHDSQSLDLMDIEDSGNDGLLITEEEEQLLGELEESALPDFSDFEDSFDDSYDESGLDDAFDIPSESAITDDPESRELLHKIEDDLSALREEIRQLKEELTGLRVPAVAPAAADAADAGGFFEDEEDETIALTGDELDNILDSADMTEQTPAKPEAAAVIESTDEGISFDDEDSIDLSGDFPEPAADEMSIGELDDFSIEESPMEDDPALSILGSPDEPEEEGDPDTIEIDIPGLDETIDLDDTEVVDIDDFSTDLESLDDFEEITDLDEFGIDEGDISEVSLDDIPLESPEDEIILDSGSEIILSEPFEDEVFDEGEAVEIDLTEDDDILEASDDAEMVDLDMEEISLDDFGLDLSEEDSEAVTESSDVLAVDDIEDIDLDNFDVDDDSDSDDIEELELDVVLAEGIEEGLGSLEEAVELDAAEDLLVDEIDLEMLEPVTSDENDDSVVIEDVDEIDDFVIEEISFDDDTEEVALEEIEPLNKGIILEEGIPEISIDDAIDEIEPAEEFSIEDEEEAGDLIEELEIELDDSDDEIQVTLPDDDFNELPGTEEVDLTSLEALASAPDLTEVAEDEIVELPEMDFDDEEILELADVESEDLQELSLDDELEELPEEPMDFDISLDEPVEEVTEFNLGDEIEEVDAEEPLIPTPRSIAEKAKAALEIDLLPGDLKNEIKEVLTYMDQLLDSLPDDKIQEFAHSEHFEVYKKIFEELGIND